MLDGDHMMDDLGVGVSRAFIFPCTSTGHSLRLCSPESSDVSPAMRFSGI